MRRLAGILLWSAAALLTACAAPQSPRPDPMNPAELLVFSGFAVKLAVTQEDLDQLATIPQRELLRVTASDPPLYIWVDGAGCRCYYAGDEAAYRKLEALGLSAGRQ
jgi:hypothetical protein